MPVKPSVSIIILTVVCAIYAFSSGALTTTNKLIYTTYAKVTPLNLLLVQCVCNIMICSLLMIYKEVNPSAFRSLVKYGIVIPPISVIPEKARLGFKVGALNLATAIFGLYSVKHVSIPL